MQVTVSFLFAITIGLSVAFGFGADLIAIFEDVTRSWTDNQLRSELRIESRIRAPLGQSTERQAALQLTLVNSGEISLEQFDSWDVILEIQREDADGLAIVYLTYTDNNPPGCNEWTVGGIYRDAATLTPETVGPGVLDPGEELIALITPNPPVEVNTYDRATFGTPDGTITELTFEVVSPSTTTVYVLDRGDDLAYRYDDAGMLLGTSALHTLNADPEGITTDVGRFWTADDSDDELYRYTSALEFAATSTLDAANLQSTGLTTDGCNIWVADNGANSVYKYTMAGASVSSFPLSGSNDDPEGVTTDGTNIWVADFSDARLYKYDMAGSAVSDTGLAPANSDPIGIGTDGSAIWVVDHKDDIVYRYDMAGAYVSEFPLVGANSDPHGLTVTPR